MPVIIPGFTPTSRRIRFGGIVSRRRESVAEGPAIGGVGGILGVVVLRLRLFGLWRGGIGDGGVAVMVDCERVVHDCVDVVADAVLLRLGLEIAFA